MTTLVLPDDEAERGDVDSLIFLATGSTVSLRGFGRVVMIGSSSTCHIRAKDEHLSRKQCFMTRDRASSDKCKGAWHIFHAPSAKNSTFVNGIAVGPQPEYLPLHLGSILRAGRSVWIASDSNRAHERSKRWLIAARTQAEFYRCALLVYGSYAAAAKSIGVPLTTFKRRLAKDPSAVLLVEQFSGSRGRRPTRVYPPIGQSVVALGIPSNLVGNGTVEIEINDNGWDTRRM